LGKEIVLVEYQGLLPVLLKLPILKKDKISISNQRKKLILAGLKKGNSMIYHIWYICQEKLAGKGVFVRFGMLHS